MPDSKRLICPVKNDPWPESGPDSEGSSRFPANLNFLLFGLLAVAGLLYLAPAVNSEPIIVGAATSARGKTGVGEASKQAEPPPAAVAAIPAKKEVPKPEKRAKSIDAFFAEHQIPTLTFEFKNEEWEFLNRDHRRYAEVTMVEEGGKTYKNVAVKLKGSAGSFQGPDGKPGLTLHFGKYKGAEPFHGMEKMHLNNCAQDGTFLMEKIAGEMCRKAHVPASRCSHAIVKWHGRDLGLYVVKEAFNRDFLAKFFPDPSGDLYDGGFVSDISENAEKDQGDENQRENVKALIAACREGDEKKRWEKIATVLDVDQFLNFLAMESILAHWDGYNFNHNNFRFYFDVPTGKAVFFCHGMDQTFGDPNFPVIHDSGAMVGQAVLSNPEWKARLIEVTQLIYDQVLVPIDWPARVTQVGKEIQAALQKANPDWAKDYEGQIANARSRVEERITAIGKQLSEIPRPMKFDAQGVAKLEPQNWRVEGGAAQIDEPDFDGRPTFHIRADGDTTASWRKNLQLPAGKYRFEGRLRTAGLEAAEASSGTGAGVRISGGNRQGQNAAQGDTAWQNASYQFDANGGEVVLVAEMRGRKGEVWFDRQSFQIVRVP